MYNTVYYTVYSTLFVYTVYTFFFFSFVAMPPCIYNISSMFFTGMLFLCLDFLGLPQWIYSTVFPVSPCRIWSRSIVTSINYSSHLQSLADWKKLNVFTTSLRPGKAFISGLVKAEGISNKVKVWNLYVVGIKVCNIYDCIRISYIYYIHIFQEQLQHHDFTKFNPLKARLLENVDKMLAEDIARLMAMIPVEEATANKENNVIRGKLNLISGLACGGLSVRYDYSKKIVKLEGNLCYIIGGGYLLRCWILGEKRMSDTHAQLGNSKYGFYTETQQN